jgi:hypothetical protein
MDEYTFQEMCRDLFAEESHISTCDIYGTRGEGQFGIDLIARCVDPTLTEVGQCKCYKDFPPAEIRKASNEFFDHLSFWQKQHNVNRFILFVACDLTKTNRQDEITEQINCFAIHNIKYEAWDSRTLRQKLSSHPEIVHRYLRSQDLVESICGPQPISRRAEVELSISYSKIESLSSNLSKAKALQLDRYRELYREGKLQEAFNCLDLLRNDRDWDVFEKPLQAKILQALAGYVTSVKQDFDKARDLAEQARILSPEQDDVLLQALIRYHSEGAEAALGLIDNPSTIGLFNLKLGLLLELGRIKEVITALQVNPNGLEFDTETLRIHALALLEIGDIRDAQAKIQQAVYEKPNWEKVRQAEAIISYFCVFSDAVPKLLTPYPQPVEWSLIKHDDESLQHLHKAAGQFQSFSCNTEKGEAQASYWKVWHLACLANDRDSQSEAQELCSELLDEDPTNQQVIIWISSRNYDINLSPSQQALELLLQNRNVDLERIITLVGVYLYQKDYQKAIQLLSDHKDNFAQTLNMQPWHFWYVQALAMNGEAENAFKEIEAIKSVEIQQSLRAIVLQKKVEEDGDWQKLIQCLESYWQDNRNSYYLLKLCQIQANLENWQYVSGKASDLVDYVGTPNALYLAVDCAWRSDQFKLCLNMLNNSQHIFQNATLPEDLCNLKISCLEQLGLISEAITEAQNLVRSLETFQNLNTLVRLQINQGDLRGAAITASRLLKHDDADPISLLRLARCLLSEDRSLAQKLWRRAVTFEITSNVLGEVINLGYYLKLESELLPFLQRAHLIAHTGEGERPFYTVGIPEILEMIGNRAKSNQELIQKYNDSDLPIHFIAEINRFPLTNIYHVFPKCNANDPNPHLQIVILARYGGRPFTDSFLDSSTKWRIHLDISAFLFAAHLGILDALENRFSPIYISRFLPNALLQELEYFQPHQPSRIDAYGEIMQLHKTKLLKLVTESATPISSELIQKLGEDVGAMLEQARALGGLVVEFLPLERIDSIGNMHPVTLDDADLERLINCRTLIELLNKKVPFSAIAYEAALQHLGDQMNESVPLQLPDCNGSIFLNSELAMLLAGSDLLVKVCRAFTVYVSPRFIHEAESSSNINGLTEITEWLKDLSKRIATGLKEVKYQMIEETADGKRERDLGAVSLTAFDLIVYPSQSNDVIWIDDRFFSKYRNRDNVTPVIGVLEILEALWVSGDLKESEYYEKLYQLRKGNVRYIPISSKEVLYHLKQAQVREQRLQETEELKVIRRYYASCLLDSQRLQLPPLPQESPNPLGEMTFIFESLDAIQSSIRNIWIDTNITDETAIAYSDWILINLYTGLFGVRHLLPNNDPDNDRLDLISHDISNLYFQGIQLWKVVGEDDNQEISNRRHKYFQWIKHRITDRRFRANPNLVCSVAQLIKEYILHLGQETKEEQQIANRPLLEEFYLDLPDILQDELRKFPELMTYLHIHLKKYVNLGSSGSTSQAFLAEEFFNAIALAVNGEEATIRALEPEIGFKISVTDQTDSSIQFKIVSELDNSIHKWYDNLMLLASDNLSIREQVLRSHRIWFDCDSFTFENAVSEILSTLDLSNRIDITSNWRKDSTAVFYLNLNHKLNKDQGLLVEDMIPPSVARLLRHFHLNLCSDENISFHDKLSSAAESMLGSENLAVCIERFSCMPVKLPVKITEAFGQLSDDVKESLLHKLASELTSPVCKLHLIGLAMLHSNSTSFAEQLVDELYSEIGSLQFRLFKAILNLLCGEFSYWQEINESSVSIRLSMMWAHASKLFNLLYDPDSITENQELYVQKIEKLSQFRQPNSDLFDRNPEFWNDVLHPRFLNRLNIGVHGLSAILMDCDRNLLQSTGIPAKVINFACVTSSNQQLLHPVLLRDLSLAQDKLDSLLGGTHSDNLGYLIGAELGQQISPQHLKELTENLIDSLAIDPLSIDKWLSIIALIGDFIIHTDLISKLDSIIQAINFRDLYHSNSLTAIFALIIACDHAANTANEELRFKLEEELVAIANIISKQKQVDDEIFDNFIDCTFRISFRANDPRMTSRSLNSLLKRIFHYWNRSLDIRAVNFIKLMGELPASQLHGTWETNLLIRALSEFRY